MLSAIEFLSKILPSIEVEIIYEETEVEDYRQVGWAYAVTDTELGLVDWTGKLVTFDAAAWCFQAPAEPAPVSEAWLAAEAA